MNNRSKKFWVVRATVATLLAGVGALGCGCDAVDAMLAAAKTTATGAAVETVNGVVGVAFERVLGGLTPGSEGS